VRQLRWCRPVVDRWSAASQRRAAGRYAFVNGYGESRVGSQDLLVEPLQRRRGIHAEFLTQQVAHALEGDQRVRTAA
jgi:hypothetical protein